LCLRAIGYDRDFSQVGGRAQIRFAPAAGFTCVDLDENALTIQLPPGVELDFGAIAKAYAVDLSVAAANAFAPSGLLFSIGGDLALDGPTPEGGWPVRVCEDHRADATAPGQTVALDAGALATSSTTTRSWHQRGHNLHHILDPTSGRPVLPHWRTVSTTAANCVEANVASTTAIIRRRGAEDWLAASNRPARLVDLNSHPLTVGGWPQ
jgi:thiamine biosynthesis lipoprotein